MSIQKSDSRTVVLGEIPKGEALELSTHMETGVSGVQDAVIQFTEVDDYTTFNAKYTLRDDTDAIVQFFLPHESGEWGAEQLQAYWLKQFPEVLNEVAQDHFQATFPRLQAKYTDEVKSWWLRAQGYGDRIDFDGFLMKFLERMDERLELQ